MSGRSVDRPLRLHSLRARLLWPLLALILLVAAGQAVFAYRGALQQADLLFDQQMKQMAEVFRLAAATAEGAPMVEALDFTVQIWGADGQRIYQSSRQQVLPGRAAPGYSIQRSSDTSYRVFSLLDRGRFVQVSQDMVARDSQARKLAWQAALPTILLLPVLLALVWGIVRRSLAPVGRLGEQLAQREVGEFSAMPIGGIPTEIRPLVAAMNDLFHRVEQAFDAQTHFVADAAHELHAAVRTQAAGAQPAPSAGADRA
ncbi:MAG: hypothetical protein R3E68_20895 [Burkholderiaceae bacterium]